MILISIFAKATLVLGAGAAVQIGLARRMSAAMRHLVWTLTIAGVLGLPLLAISLPDWNPVEYTEPAGFVQVIGIGLLDSSVPAAPAAVPASQSGAQWQPILMAVYLAGVVVLLARVVLQHLWTRRLVRAATPIVEAPWLQLLRECTARIGVRRNVRLLRAASDTMPAAMGIRQAFIVLPTVADKWPENRRRAVLLHELAHVERHDCLTQTLAAVACAAYWVHPGVWSIARRLRAERELACDDRVLSAGEDAREYAGHLLELAASTLAHGTVPAVVVTMVRRRELEGRMLAVLDAARNRAIPALRNRLAGIVILVGLTVPVAAVTITPRFHALDAEELRVATGGPFAQIAVPAAGPRRSFDVASIKRTSPDDSRPGADFSAEPGGRLVARNNEVSNFITNAYGIPGYTLIGGPEWMRVDRYNLEAKADGEPSRADMMLMLQTLLAERFQFRMHRETREMPAYVLTVARGGAKLTPSKDGGCVDRSPANRMTLPANEQRPGCGNNNLSLRGATPPNIRWTAVRVDMASVTGALALFFRRPVVDRTGLIGVYDIQLELPPLQPATLDAGAPDPGVSVFTVLQEQLGLRVEEGKGPVDVLVVDSIQRPTEN